MQTPTDTNTNTNSNSGPSSAPADDVTSNVATQMEKYNRDIAAIADTMYAHATTLAATGRPAEDTAEACTLYESASTLGHLSAMFQLSLLLYTGVPGFIASDIPRSITLLETAIDKGYVDAMYVLAHHFHVGTLPSTFTSTTSHDDIASNATKRRTTLFNFKLQQQHDGVRAKQLYERARNHGHVKAVTELGVLLEHGSGDGAVGGKGVPRDEIQARRLYEEAAGQGEVFALGNLAWTYERGNLGVRRDIARAVALYVHAARKGCKRAVGRLQELAPGEVDRLREHVNGDGGRMEDGGGRRGERNTKNNAPGSPTSVSMATTARRRDDPLVMAS